MLMKVKTSSVSKMPSLGTLPSIFQTLTLFLDILNKLKFECASKSMIFKEHQDEDTKQKSKSIRITNHFKTHDDFYFMSAEMFVSTPTFRHSKTLFTLQNSIIYSNDWLNNKLSNGEFVVNANIELLVSRILQILFSMIQMSMIRNVKMLITPQMYYECWTSIHLLFLRDISLC